MLYEAFLLKYALFRLFFYKLLNSFFASVFIISLCEFSRDTPPPPYLYRVFAPDRIVVLDEDNPRYARRRIFTPHDQIRYTLIFSRSVDLALQVVVSIYLAKRYMYILYVL